VEWIQLPHDQWRDLVNTVMNVRVQQSSWATISFSRRKDSVPWS
jgi:hypothetical protein